MNVNVNHICHSLQCMSHLPPAGPEKIVIKHVLFSFHVVPTDTIVIKKSDQTNNILVSILPISGQLNWSGLPNVNLQAALAVHIASHMDNRLHHVIGSYLLIIYTERQWFFRCTRPPIWQRSGLSCDNGSRMLLK